VARARHDPCGFGWVGLRELRTRRAPLDDVPPCPTGMMLRRSINPVLP
jgi:hypothetical protein